jgi:hypothetical protein
LVIDEFISSESNDKCCSSSSRMALYNFAEPKKLSMLFPVKSSLNFPVKEMLSFVNPRFLRLSLATSAFKLNCGSLLLKFIEPCSVSIRMLGSLMLASP